MIDLAEIATGDVVTIQDASGNRARGPVVAGVESWKTGQTLTITAFRTSIVFARQTRTGRMMEIPGVKLLDHQPQLSSA